MRYLLFLALSVFLLSCSTGKITGGPDTNNEQPKQTISKGSPAADLTAYLRKVGGVEVIGTGPRARFKIRDDNGTSAGTPPPMFVVDGRLQDISYFDLYHMVQVTDIKSVRVRKGASQTAAYGYAGAGGVIEIRLNN